METTIERRVRIVALLLAGAVMLAGCQERPRQTVTQPLDTPQARALAQPAVPAAQPTTAPAVQPATAPTAQVETGPAAPTPAAPSARSGAAEEIAERLPTPPPPPFVRRAPKRPADSWIIFREAFRPADDAACTADWTGDNRLEVHTENIQRLTIDLTRLPDGAPAKGPWNLQIDGQGVELTGFRPKPGYTGLIRDLVRSENGNWTVDRKALYRLPLRSRRRSEK